MKETKKKNEKGFTMIELIIVVAIMAIIGAVLVPMYGTMSSKARLTSDISSIKTLQRQLDAYKAEEGNYPTDLENSSSTSSSGLDLNTSVISELVNKGYLDSKDLISTGSNYALKLQTGGKIKEKNKRCYLAVGTSGTYADIVDKLGNKDGNKEWAQKE